MSRVGKNPIKVPEGIQVSIKDNVVEVKKGNIVLSEKIHESIEVKTEDGRIEVSPKKGYENAGKFWGLSRTLISNMVKGIEKGFSKKMEISGVGYKVKVEGGKKIILEVGLSHPVELEIPEDLEVKVVKNIIEVLGVDKRRVGQFAAEIRDVKPPEPYKGKGIKYIDEYVPRKEGKKAVGEEGTAA